MHKLLCDNIENCTMTIYVETKYPPYIMYCPLCKKEEINSKMILEYEKDENTPKVYHFKEIKNAKKAI